MSEQVEHKRRSTLIKKSRKIDSTRDVKESSNELSSKKIKVKLKKPSLGSRSSDTAYKSSRGESATFQKSHGQSVSSRKPSSPSSDKSKADYGYGKQNRRGPSNKSSSSDTRTQRTNSNAQSYNKNQKDTKKSRGAPNRREFGNSPDKQSSQKRTYRATRKKQFVGKRKQFEEKEISLKDKKSKPVITNPVPKSVDIMESISVVDLAKKMNLKASELLSKLIAMGMMEDKLNINSIIDSETAQLLADEYECKVNIVSLYDQTLVETNPEKEEDRVTRPPVVTIMGHVDHGKTTLLDVIHNTNVVDNEQGAITQHLGAYRVKVKDNYITFLDTPGHEAFFLMRERGITVTDIVLLVIAADDGVKPQTIEAINLIKKMQMPMIIVLNKIDSPNANPERVFQQLSEYDIIPEEWGGDVAVCKISALKNEGIEDLLEHILLHTEVLDIKASEKVVAQGVVLESKMEHGKGVVASILLQKGTLTIGDPFIVGVFHGKVRDMYDDKGNRIKKVTPSMPVGIIGIEGMPSAGDLFQVTESEKISKQVAIKRQELMRQQEGQSITKVNADNLYESIAAGNTNTLKLIIKGDVHGSIEALQSSLEKITHEEVRIQVISASVGTINAADVALAATSQAIIIGFNVRPSQQIQKMAQQERVQILRYSIIFKVIEDMTKQLESMLSPVYEEEKIGEVLVKEIFTAPKVGVIAGSYIEKGKVEKNSIAKVMRNDKIIHSGKIISLKHHQENVNSMDKGFECGIVIENANDIEEGDALFIYKEVEVARTL